MPKTWTLHPNSARQWSFIYYSLCLWDRALTMSCERSFWETSEEDLKLQTLKRQQFLNFFFLENMNFTNKWKVICDCKVDHLLAIQTHSQITILFYSNISFAWSLLLGSNRQAKNNLLLHATIRNCLEIQTLKKKD